MAKTNTNEMLKKHHFWLLFGFSMLFVLLAFVFLGTGVSGAIDTKAADNKKEVDTVTGTRPPGKGVIDGLAEQQKELKKRKDELWQENWNTQKKYFTWPQTATRQFDRFNTLKFGTDISKDFSDFDVQEFRRESAYKRMFEEMAAGVAPTAFPGGWQKALRWVADWGVKNPDSKQLWVLMEDVWVQRALLDPIRQANTTISKFEPVNPDPTTPLKRQFRSRVWDLFLEVGDGPNGKQFKARLVNRTPQLQLLGAGNRMYLRVRVDPNPGLPPVDLLIEGEFAPGSSEYPVREKDAKEPGWATYPVTPGITPTELAGVEQVLDARTVPVRQVVELRLGYLSAKNAAMLAKESKTLEKPKFWPEDAAVPAAGGAETGGGTSGGLPPQGELGGLRGGGTDLSGLGGAAMGPGGTGGGTLTGVADMNKKRYLVLTDQIRRMPVGLVLVCDQMYVQDVLIALANSPLRFETVQYHWRRLNTDPAATGSGGLSGPPGSGGYGGSRGGEDSGPIGGSIGSGFGSSSGGLYNPPGGELSAPPGMGMGEGSGYGGYGGSPFAGLFNSVSEAQANAGLVELSVYGIISLYETYVPSDAPPADPSATAAPAPAPAPMGDTPKPADPTTPMPMGDAPKTEPKAADPKADPKSEPKTEPKTEPKVEPKTEPKGADPKGEPPPAEPKKM